MEDSMPMTNSYSFHGGANDPQNAKELSGFDCEIEGAICQGTADYQCRRCRKLVCAGCSYDETCYACREIIWDAFIRKHS
jgi:hypothetical protein